MAYLNSNYFHIELMGFENLEEVLKIERASFSSPWDRSIFISELKNPQSYIFLLKEIIGDTKIVKGYICLWAVDKQAHILNLAVDPSSRRRGFASSLLYFALDYSFKKKESGRAILEVREKNYPARFLYDKFDFSRIGIKPQYYQDTNENALILSLERSIFLGSRQEKKLRPIDKLLRRDKFNEKY